MSRLAFSLLFLLVGISPSEAQDPHPIGYADTLLFNDSLHYTAFGYDGPAPLFVQAWFPLGGTIAEPVGRLDPNNLRFHELRRPKLPPALQEVHQQLLLRMDSAFIEYCLRYPFDGDEPIEYAPFTEQQVKDSLFALGTHAFRAGLPLDAGRPVIVYHHGSQGLSDENVWMAEYFAENGFVFLSCNFHWPLEGKMYGTPLVWQPDRSSIRTMLRFARQLANGNKVFYIGHSWGAQEGWCTLHEPGLVDAFVSLETTMEWKTDTAEVRDKWPHMLEAITTRNYPMPILMVADTEGEPPFPMFAGVQGDVRYLDPKEDFGHESYTSAYLLRRAGDGRFAIPDREALDAQFDLHAGLLEELLAFLQDQAERPVTPPHHGQGDPFHRFPVPAAVDQPGR
jgi:pimeloyl-ACP methyl ester carboxylesterase